MIIGIGFKKVDQPKVMNMKRAHPFSASQWGNIMNLLQTARHVDFPDKAVNITGRCVQAAPAILAWRWRWL